MTRPVGLYFKEVYMHPDFWHQRWAENQIGFHETEVNLYLQKFWADFGGSKPGRVLVPMCGKSLDMRWLAESGWSVLGVELSQLAVENFFHEWGQQAREQPAAEFRCYSAGKVEILCGDFFHLEPLHVQGVGAVYDRASLVALPADLRAAYAAQLRTLLPQAPQMLVCVDYDQQAMHGPPFAVAEEEVRRLYGQAFQIEVLTRSDVLATSPRFRERGLTYMEETVYRLLP